MKKVALFLVVVLFSLTQLVAQESGFKNGDMVGNLGVGFGWYGYGYGVSSLPAFSLSLEKGILDLQNIGPLSIGGIVGFKHASYAYTSAYSFTWNDIIIAARGSIHYDLFKNKKIDTYGGVALGVRIQSYSFYTPIVYEKGTTSTTRALLALYIGGRYFFTDKLAGFGELGYGLGYLTLGLSYKF
jgi:hypothetical protein